MSLLFTSILHIVTLSLAYWNSKKTLSQILFLPYLRAEQKDTIDHDITQMHISPT